MDLYTDEYMKAVSSFKNSTKAQSEAYDEYRKKVFDATVFDKKTQELIALSAAAAIQCTYCIDAHSKKAKAYGANAQELATAIHIATVIKAGATQAYGTNGLIE